MRTVQKKHVFKWKLVIANINSAQTTRESDKLATPKFPGTYLDRHVNEPIQFPWREVIAQVVVMAILLYSGANSLGARPGGGSATASRDTNDANVFYKSSQI